jgi:acyl-CoA synthetase (NDP forming)
MMAHGFEKTAGEILRGLLDDDGVHGIGFISFATMGTEPYQPIVDLIQQRQTKPVFFSLLGSTEDVEVCRVFLMEKGIPFYLYPEMGVRVFSHMRQYAEHREKRDE